MLHSWGTMMFLCFAKLKRHLTGGAQKYSQNQVCFHETWFFLWWIVLYHHACTLICMHVGYHKYSLRLGSFVCLGICCVVGVRWWLCLCVCLIYCIYDISCLYICVYGYTYIYTYICTHTYIYIYVLEYLNPWTYAYMVRRAHAYT